MAYAAEKQISFTEGWRKISAAITKLETLLDEDFDKVAGGSLFDNKEYMDCYASVYNMCTQRPPHNHTDQLYDRHGSSIEDYLSRSVMPSLEKLDCEHLLKAINRRWKNHQIMNKWMYNFFNYLDRYHVSYSQVSSLSEVGLRQFKIVVFDQIKVSLATAVISIINTERDGTFIDESLVRSCVSLFENMGLRSMRVYEEDFEQELLESSKVYYTDKTATWMASDPTPVYLTKIEDALEKETKRVHDYLNVSTLPKLLHVLEDEGLEKRKMELLEKEGSGCRVLLEQEKHDDLARMFRMFSRLTAGLEPMAVIFEEHIVKLGTEIFEARAARLEADAAAAGAKGGDKDINNDPQFIKDLLNLHEKYLEITSKYFQNKPLFQKALESSFSKIMNSIEGKGSVPDLLSSFCDRILKKGEKLNEAETENFLERVVKLFTYVQDKDMFGEIFRNQLAKRLLNEKSNSDELERSMIGKLKIACGAQFTAKLEGMMNDLAIGKDHQKKYDERKQREDLKHLPDFGVQILTQGHWPTYKSILPKLPSRMSECVKSFQDFYLSVDENGKRRLIWQYTLGTASVRMSIEKDGKSKVYDFDVHTMQAAALEIFNTTPGPISIGDLVVLLGLEEPVIMKIVHSLVCGKYKILKKSGSGTSDSKGIKPSDSFEINSSFSSPMRKMKLIMSSLEDSHNPKRIEEDRGHAIEACIVRTMKSRKTLAHQPLVAEVLNQLTLFKPDPKTVKKHIASLIERDFLERAENNSTVYNYLA